MTILDYAAIGLTVSLVVACAAGAWLRRQEEKAERARRFAELVVACEQRAQRYEVDGVLLTICLDTAARDIAIARVVNEFAHPAAHLVEIINRRTSWRPHVEVRA